MKLHGYNFITPVVGMLMMLSFAVAIADPTPNSAVIKTRIFNDCPFSTIVTANTYPANIQITDTVNPEGCTGFANLHNWRFSADGGATPIQFHNNHAFTVSAELTISGPGHAEAGLQVSPWFSPDIDGRFNVRTTDGEIAVFGGVLPFYSFTSAQFVTYTKGTPIRLEVAYDPRSNTEADPAVIVYGLTYNATTYTSGPLAMTGCNMAEEPIYGCYGILNQAQVGGHLQVLWQASPNQAIGASTLVASSSTADWTNITYSPDGPTPAKPTSWGRVKMLYR